MAGLMDSESGDHRVREPSRKHRRNQVLRHRLRKAIPRGREPQYTLTHRRHQPKHVKVSGRIKSDVAHYKRAPQRAIGNTHYRFRYARASRPTCNLEYLRVILRRSHVEIPARINCDINNPYRRVEHYRSGRRHRARLTAREDLDLIREPLGPTGGHANEVPTAIDSQIGTPDGEVDRAYGSRAPVRPRGELNDRVRRG